MSDRIRDFLRRRDEDGPCVVVDLDIVRDNFEAFAKSLPDTSVYYAVKANPAPEILSLLESLGSSFDCASVGEIEMVLATGASADRISYGNTIKKEKDIARAYQYGVRLFAVDCVEEVEKSPALPLAPKSSAASCATVSAPSGRSPANSAATPKWRPTSSNTGTGSALSPMAFPSMSAPSKPTSRRGISLSPWQQAFSRKWRSAASN